MTPETVSLDSFAPAVAPDQLGLLLVYGAPGVGKTTFGATGPGVCFLDAEGGTRTLGARPDVRVARVTSWEQVKDVSRFLATAAHPFSTVVLDSATEMYGFALDKAMREDKKMQGPDGTLKPGAMAQLQHHNPATDWFLRMLRAWRDLAATKNWTVVLTAGEKADVDEETSRVLLTHPDLPPAALRGANRIVDGMVRLRLVKGGARVLTLNTADPAVMAKFRVPATLHLPPEIENPTIPQLLALLKKGQAS